MASISKRKIFKLTIAMVFVVMVILLKQHYQTEKPDQPELFKKITNEKPVSFSNLKREYLFDKSENQIKNLDVLFFEFLYNGVQKGLIINDTLICLISEYDLEIKNKRVNNNDLSKQAKEFMDFIRTNSAAINFKPIESLGRFNKTSGVRLYFRAINKDVKLLRINQSNITSPENAELERKLLNIISIIEDSNDKMESIFANTKLILY